MTSSSTEERRAELDGGHAVHIKIPEDLTPSERHDKYEDPLTDALAELGEITGGGTMVIAGRVRYVGIDLRVRDLETALAVIARTLRELDAPRGTMLEHGDGSNAPFEVWE